MSHYWTGDDPIETRREQVVDWIEDLVEFGAHAVAQACGEWRRTQERRPTPSAIRKLCIEAQTVQRERLAIAAPADMDEYARSVGWKSEAERRAAISADVARRSRRGAEMAADGRDVSNNWARERGYLNLKDYMTQQGLDFNNDDDYIEACLRVIATFPGPKTMPRAAGGKLSDPHAVAAALGVKAREYQPTAEQLRAGRIALGLEQADAEDD